MKGNIGARKGITKYVLDLMITMEPEGHNYKLWKDRLENASDAEFDAMMKCFAEGRDCLHIETPNQLVTLQFENIMKAANLIGLDLFQRLTVKDATTGVVFNTVEKYQIVELPERRLQQTIYEKMSVPTSDRKIDGLTGQVTGADRSSSLTFPEIQALDAQKLDKPLEEFIVARGGNIAAYAAMKQSIEETGSARLEDVIDPNSISRSTMVLDTFFLAMGYETNLTDRSE